MYYLPVFMNNLPLSIDNLPFSMNNLQVFMDNLPLSLNNLQVSMNNLPVFISVCRHAGSVISHICPSVPTNAVISCSNPSLTDMSQYWALL